MTREKLKKYHQERLLEYISSLNEREQETLLKKLDGVDFSLFEEVALSESKESVLEPIPYLSTEKIEREKKILTESGVSAMKQGKLACVLLAGGQGTRLGFDHPKGMYNVGISHPIYIFELHIARLKDVFERTGVYVPLFIMTSEKNHRETVSFFEEHEFFGYKREMVRFFEQGMAPCMGLDGNLLLEDRLTPAFSPDGNGGWYAALKKSGILQEFPGVEWFNVFGVDNLLARPADPAFLGATILQKKTCGVKGVKKCCPEEKVGLLVLKDKCPAIVEYYEMDGELAKKKDEKGELVFNFGVTLNYLFLKQVLEEMAGERLPVHAAKKKVTFFDGNAIIVPERENAYKFETLILDMVRFSDPLAYETIREKEFAPVKNLTGVDSVDSARELLAKQGVKL